jgi:tetratricopeptide (TPR) repeat protein
MGRVEEENRQLNKVVSALSKEHVVLNDQINDLKNKIIAQRAESVNYYSEAGDVYMQYSLYDKAIEAYNKAAKIDPNDAKVQLRLGFLYKRVQDEPKEAVSHFKRYLLLMPHAKDRKEVQYMIEMLSNNSNSDWSNN